MLATRPLLLTASILHVILGTDWGYRQAGELDVTALALALSTARATRTGADQELVRKRGLSALS